MQFCCATFVGWYVVFLYSTLFKFLFCCLFVFFFTVFMFFSIPRCADLVFMSRLLLKRHLTFSAFTTLVIIMTIFATLLQLSQLCDVDLEFLEVAESFYYLTKL